MINGKVRARLAAALAPKLAGKQSVGLAYARSLLHEIEPSLAIEIDGMEAAHVLRRAGFVKDYSRPVGPSLYKRATPA